ncbi:MAG TPA: DUF3558 domain-containing protein [Pseudonocardiaceae bacterium]|nr:DUF3558 domain-containing protein [Pseudonocardiaceae bacterium]
MSRGAVVAAMAVTGLLAGGCGSAVSGEPESPGVGDASGVDMCTVLTDAELRGLGIDLGTREKVDELGVIGCQWVGKPFTLRLENNEDTVAEYKERRDAPNFTSFQDNSVNGRAGVQFGVRTAGDQCVQLTDGGPVSLAVGVAAASSQGPPLDPCAEALRIAQMIEPRLPKAGT